MATLTPNLIELRPYVRCVFLVLTRHWRQTLTDADWARELSAMGWHGTDLQPESIEMALLEMTHSVTSAPHPKPDSDEPPSWGVLPPKP